MSEAYFVADKFDPSGNGMFSKAGRATTEKNIIFQRKDEIVNGKKQLRNSQSQPTLPHIQGEKGGSKWFKQKEEKKNEKTIKKEEATPFYKQLSREYIHKTKSYKQFGKPVGYYQPKYKEVDKNQHLVWNILKVYNNQTESKQVFTPVDTTEFELSKQIPEKFQQKVQGLIELDRCIKRDGKCLKNPRDDPHDKRFESFNVTTSFSNIKRIPTFNLERLKGRDPFIKKKDHQPDYNPNYEFGKTQVGLNTGPQFDGRPNRKPNLNVSQTNNEDFYDFNSYVRRNNASQVFKNVLGQDFNKMLPRDIDAALPLPSFMQKHVNLRQTLGSLHHKMLEQNHFFEGRFLSTNSEFGKTHIKFNKKDQPIKQNSEESIDDIDA